MLLVVASVQYNKKKDGVMSSDLSVTVVDFRIEQLKIVFFIRVDIVAAFIRLF